MMKDIKFDQKVTKQITKEYQEKNATKLKKIIALVNNMSDLQMLSDLSHDLNSLLKKYK